MEQPGSAPRTVKTVESWRIATTGDDEPVERTPFQLAREARVTLNVVDVAVYTIMCTPMDLEPLALGFLHAAGMIQDADAIESIALSDAQPYLLDIRFRNPGTFAAPSRHIAEPLLGALPPVESTLRVPRSRLPDMVQALRDHQRIYPQSGGTHAAAVFDAEGNVVAFAEDVGRHNALDKAVGTCLLAHRATAGCSVAMSGRVSLEMVMKCARAKIQLISAVSAPTSLAVEAADQWGITLCGIVRDDRATVFTHPERILGLT